ncbi:MAG: Rrf2 family transcriptional regulator [candidate division KSB1 bacterium]|nr:Rrf2 family transcriptional regulator [candidate division KSB1 bacterium]
MLKLSKKSEYGIIALKHIYLHGPEHLSSAREISQRYLIPVEIMAKILQSLARAGLVESIKGARGGYRLLKDAADISVKDVVHAIEGPVGLVECALEADGCSCVQYNLGVCNIDEPLAKIQFEFEKFLDRIKLPDLA